MHDDFAQRVEKIIKRDQRYKPDAYEFMMQALVFTQRKLKRQGHVSGRELLDGVKEWGLKQYGPLARHLLERWGVRKTDDFGRIVFNMIDEGLLGRREQDSLEDFRDVYDFKRAFDAFGIGKPSGKRARKDKPYEKIA